MSPPSERPTFRESAVIVLIRDHGANLEVFWAKRSDEVAVQPGFRAFLGGKVDAADAELPIAGAADLADRAARACAIREAFEEAGVLVGLEAPVAGAPLEPARARLLAGETSFAALALEHGWRFRADALVFAGRWQTPAFSHARFDTIYWLARVPEGQEPRVTKGELESGEWVKPLAALDRYRHGEVTFVAPILWTLIALAEGEDDLAARLASGPERAGQPVRRIEMKWGIVLHPMKTRPLPPATHTNAYLVGERELALIDPGSGEPEELQALFALTDQLATDGRRVTMILVTHHHPDHTGGVEAARQHYRVPVCGHAELARALKLDVTLRDGEWLPLLAGLGDWNLRVLHTPGHSRDHLCFLHPRTRSLFAGDLIPGGTGTVVIDPPDGDMTQYLASLERLLTLGIETIFPAHGAPQGAAERRIRGLIRHRLEREAKVHAALGDDPRDLATLVELAYTDTPRELYGWAERSLLAHLIKLESDGRAVRVGERWQRA